MYVRQMDDIKIEKRIYKHSMFEDINKLLKLNYETGKECYTWITEEDSLIMSSFRTLCCVAKMDEKILGFICTIPYHFMKSNRQKIKLGLITLFCVEKSVRSTGIGKKLADKMREYCKCSLNSYYYISKRNESGNEWRLWMRPINIDSARSHGFHFSNDKDSRGRDNRLREKMRLRQLQKDVEVSECAMEEFVYMCKTKQYPIFTQKQWKSLCRNYIVRSVIDKGDQVACFCIRTSMMSISKGKHKHISKCKYLFFHSGDEKSALHGAIKMSKGSDVLFVDKSKFSDSTLLSLGFSKCVGNTFINGYVDHTISTLVFI